MTGAGIALVLLAIFLSGGGDFNLGYWVLLPITTVSVGGALGGIIYSLMDHLRNQGRWKVAVANSLSLLLYIVSVWLSLVAALNVTGHWD
ncbi:hypothetical protein PKOR_20390 [Pontibacter korlensis]|uniref:Potassium transporter KefB n=2 Tax=Pontibacter korlensis TaxID=400092 RepID=A0A0E3V032_9BACT|nr:hypothetical protein PKOR_20390 [Pontibacter korlensis]